MSLTKAEKSSGAFRRSGDPFLVTRGEGMSVDLRAEGLAFSLRSPCLNRKASGDFRILISAFGLYPLPFTSHSYSRVNSLWTLVRESTPGLPPFAVHQLFRERNYQDKRKSQDASYQICGMSLNESKHFRQFYVCVIYLLNFRCHWSAIWNSERERGCFRNSLADQWKFVLPAHHLDPLFYG